MKNRKLILTVTFGTLFAGAVCAAHPGPHGHRPAPRPMAHHAVHHAPPPPVVHHHHHHHHHPPHGYLSWRRGPIHAHYRNCWLNGVWYDAVGYAYYAPAGYVYQPTVVVTPPPAPVVVAPAPVVVTPPVQRTVIRTY